MMMVWESEGWMLELERMPLPLPLPLGIADLDLDWDFGQFEAEKPMKIDRAEID